MKVSWASCTDSATIQPDTFISALGACASSMLNWLQRIRSVLQIRKEARSGPPPNFLENGTPWQKFLSLSAQKTQTLLRAYRKDNRELWLVFDNDGEVIANFEADECLMDEYVLNFRGRDETGGGGA